MKKASGILQKGFTLIELLIVIALLGALAVGMIATIDPFEQLKKGQDTARRNIVSELYNAAIRYYGVKGTFPWGTETWSPYITLAQAANYVNTIATMGELKLTFMEAAAAHTGKIFITAPDEQSLSVCFEPESK
jgi:prepilin-type N-terminal cleavage/methylation domain-containing protein